MFTKSTYTIALIGLVFSFCGPVNCHAGEITLKPDSYSLVKDTGDRFPTAFTLLFDLSEIPSDVMIDLAELTVSADIDASKVNLVNVLAHAVLGEWTASTTLNSESVETTDTLFASGFMTLDDDMQVRINVTDIVTRWHAGVLANNGLVVSLADDTDIKSVEPANDASGIKVELRIFYSK